MILFTTALTGFVIYLLLRKPSLRKSTYQHQPPNSAEDKDADSGGIE
jgi:hypothetical protein